MLSIEERLKRHTRREGACLVWVAATNGRGYGQMRIHGRTVYPHRASYELVIGPIPPGHVIDHLCRNPLCVEPSHLEPVPMGTNSARGLRGFELTGTCRAGLHDMTDPANIMSRSDGRRQCLPCRRSFERRRPARLKRPRSGA